MYMRYHLETYEPKSHQKHSDLKLNVHHSHTSSLPLLLPQQLSPMKEKSPQLSKMGEQILKQWGFFPDIALTTRKEIYTEHTKQEKKYQDKFDDLLYNLNTQRPKCQKNHDFNNDFNLKKSVHFNNVVTVKDMDGQVSQKEIKLFSRNKRRQRTKLENLTVFS
ncbi:unnamed protein product [Paramecium pentaurelia]|uniref:Uncharacterized protein n=1 Tax=Paramecium pentaurelia TaxID=43138 RepID=A0A8S1V7R4_9CILI|nr:unnamed protein product [Paramecium pentaurelia]